MFAIYSPDLYAAQQEYLLALKASRIPGLDETILDSTRKRLLLWDLSEEQLRKIEEEKTPIKTMLFDSPMTGFVIEKDILKGKHVMPGENLFTIADISTLWILADIYENDIPLIKVGQPVEVELSSFPSQKHRGRITYIYPYLEQDTRTMKVRIEIGNPGFKLKPEMFGTTLIHLDLGERLSVPEDAVLDSGVRKIVFIKKEETSFEPREIVLGVRAGDQYEVISGVEEGNQVVTSANFLIDSESRLKAAIKKTHQH